MFSIQVIASIFLTIEAMSHKKLQKLCFYAQAYYLSKFGEELITTDFQAWVHGPVSQELYDTYKHYGWKKIPKKSKELFNSDHRIYKFIEYVYDQLGYLSANELEDKTHQEDPWIEARRGLLPYESSDNVITISSMIKYYKNEMLES